MGGGLAKFLPDGGIPSPPRKKILPPDNYKAHKGVNLFNQPGNFPCVVESQTTLSLSCSSQLSAPSLHWLKMQPVRVDQNLV